uniref:Putative secreted protein n=1 Tax=Anopheles marajoara TaxID=58244 RepID=A0A2M4C6J3_9DIPT
MARDLLLFLFFFSIPVITFRGKGIFLPDKNFNSHYLSNHFHSSTTVWVRARRCTKRNLHTACCAVSPQGRPHHCHMICATPTYDRHLPREWIRRSSSDAEEKEERGRCICGRVCVSVCERCCSGVPFCTRDRERERERAREKE